MLIFNFWISLWFEAHGTGRKKGPFPTMSVGVLTTEREAHYWEYKKCLSYQDAPLAFCKSQAIHTTLSEGGDLPE